MTDEYRAACLDCGRDDRYVSAPSTPPVETGQKRGVWCPGCDEKTDHRVVDVRRDAR